MEIEANPATKAPASGRWGLRGDIPWRMLDAALRSCPWYLEHIGNVFWSGLIGWIAGRPVSALAGNLRALGVPWPEYRAWLAIRRFGSVVIDGMRARAGVGLEWEVEGVEHLRAAEATGRPVVLWTAHMGSYDAAAAFFADRFRAKLHTVRRPERNARMQRLRSSDHRAMESGKLSILYNEAGEEGLALELMRVLGDGQWVALQADRALPGLSTFRIVVDGLCWTLPKGPFFLPLVARAICLPVFVVRRGPRHYRVSFHPPVSAQSGRDRAAGVDALARAWVPLLAATVRAHPDQWFVFEPMIEKADGRACSSKGQEVRRRERDRWALAAPYRAGLAGFPFRWAGAPPLGGAAILCGDSAAGGCGLGAAVAADL